MTSVHLGCPTTRDFSPAYVSSLWLTRFNGPCGWSSIEGQAIDIGRNAVVRSFLKTGMDFLIMHDSDATWDPEAVTRLTSRNLPVVSAVIFKRDIPTVPTIGKDVGPTLEANGTRMYSFADTINHIMRVAKRERLGEGTPAAITLPEHDDDVQEIDGAGAHFLCIRRDVLEAIGEPWFLSTRTNAGEDFDFCRRVKAAGFSLYVDYSVFTGHVLGPGKVLGVREFLLYAEHKELNLIWQA
jgi:hypothetical protein